MIGIRLVIVIWCFLGTNVAWAQASNPLKSPVVRESTEVPYPDGGEGGAVVVLKVLVEKNGSVGSVEVLEGAEPFAEQARRAVLEWQFEPARRGDDAVAAWIRARVEFRQPVDAPTAAAPDGPSARKTAQPTAATVMRAEDATPQEVTVLGRRSQPGQATLSAAEVREMPGAFGDPFRAVEALPSVTPMLSGIPYFYVRGAPPNNNGYFLDGVRVPFLFHVAFGPGVIHPWLLERIDFYPGVPPASFGGVAGGVVAGHTRAPAERAHGEASLRLVDAGALVESPFADERGSALIAGRYGYPGPIVGAVSDVTLGYWDYQARVTLRAGERHTLGALAFGSHDFLGHLDDSGTEVEDLVSDFHRVDLRYDHEWSDGRARVGTTLGYDSQGTNPTYLTNRSFALRFELEQDISRGLRFRGGADARIDAYGFRLEQPADPERSVMPSSASPPRTNVTTGAWAELVWRVVPRIEVVPGARVALFDSRVSDGADITPRRTTVPAVEPRLTARVTLAPALDVLSTFGISHQYPTLRVGSLPAPVAAGAGFPEGSSKLQRVLQASEGVELRLPARIVLGATGFLSRSSGLTDLTQSCIQIEPASAPPGEGPRPDDPWFCPNETPVEGHAYGFELLVRRSFGERLSGLVSYTLSRSVREAHFLTPDGGDAVATVPSEFDRTHVLNAVLAYDLGRNWRAGSRFVFYSGAPYSQLSGNVPVPPYNAFRDPAFVRLDVRLEKRWRLGPNSSLSLIFEGQNITLSKDANTLGMDCRGEETPDGYTTECVRGEVGPITIPSVGLEATF